jgi:hypothetical protein
MAEGGGRDYFAEKAQAWSHEHGEIIVFDSTGRRSRTSRRPQLSTGGRSSTARASVFHSNV